MIQRRRVDPRPLAEPSPFLPHAWSAPEGPEAAALPDVPGAGVNERIEDPARIREVLRALFALRATGFARMPAGHAVETRCEAPVPGDRRPLRFRFEAEPDATPRHVHLLGFNSVFKVPLQNVRWHDAVLSCEIPDEIRRLRQRAERRSPAPEGLQVRLRFDEPGGIVRIRSVHDVSPSGLSFVAGGCGFALVRGLRVPGITVLQDGREVARLKGEVRRVAAPIGQLATVCGLRVEPESEADREAWRALVQGIANPTTRSRGTPVDHTWALFEESGYFQLSSARPGQFEALQRDFEVASRRLDATPSLGAQVVVPMPGGIAGSLSSARIYEGTWFPGMFAKRKGAWGGLSSRQILRDTNIATFEHAQHDPGFRWLLIFLHESARWTQMAYRDWPRQHFASGEAWSMGIEAWIGRSAGEDAPRDPTLEFGPADPAEQGRLCDVATRDFSWQYADALDLVPERLHLASLTRRWAEAGLRRERTVLAARRDGRAVAVAVLEDGEPGTHLFHMYDAVRLFALCEGGQDAFADLLRVARRWYRERGHDTFVHFVERNGRAGAAEDAGLKRLGAANFLLISRRLLPDLMECVHEVTAPGDTTLEGEGHVEDRPYA